jgi:hypothetical protein
MSAITTEKSLLERAICGCVYFTIHGATKSYCAALLPSLCVWHGLTHTRHSRSGFRMKSYPPRRDSTSCPPQALHSVLCCLLFVFADTCCAPTGDHTQVQSRARLARVRARVMYASSIGYQLKEAHVHAVRVCGCAMCEDEVQEMTVLEATMASSSCAGSSAMARSPTSSPPDLCYSRMMGFDS